MATKSSKRILTPKERSVNDGLEIIFKI